jgi:hypothetical protein
MDTKESGERWGILTSRRFLPLEATDADRPTSVYGEAVFGGVPVALEK